MAEMTHKYQDDETEDRSFGDEMRDMLGFGNSDDEIEEFFWMS